MTKLAHTSDMRGYEISAEEGMIITEDVYNRNTVNKLVSAGTVITTHILEKLCLHGIKYVKIGNSQERVLVDDNWLFSDILETLAFKQFTGHYDDVLSVVRQELLTVMNNPTCELERIVTAVLRITDKVTTNAQTLNFIRYIKQGDDAIFSHCLNVALLCGLYGLWMNLSKEDISNLILSGVFHDIGKIHISSNILYKPGKLTDTEFKEIKKHTIYGYQLLNKPHIPKAVQMSALMHHEKWDGTGYPLGRSGMAINRIATIVAICDVYEAMTAHRVYRSRISPFMVIKQFERGDFGALSEGHLFTFRKRIAESFIGNKVMLTDKREGTVVFINPQDLAHPLVKCADVFVDLSKNKVIGIANVL